jgi:hypothetical protein
MSATGSNQQSLNSKKFGNQRQERILGDGTATLIELGIAFAQAESNPAVPGQCSHCLSYRNPKNSTAQFPNVFCSEECEKEFVRAALASLTVEDCIRIHGLVEALLTA